MSTKIVPPESLAEVVTALAQGHVVAIPTETVYGLAASINQIEALKQIFHLKERPFFDPLIVHIGNFKMIEKVVDPSGWSDVARYFANLFWPGPLTLILPKHTSISPIITSGLQTVGVRFPSHPLTQKLICELGEPLAAPSANKFGKTSPSAAQHVADEFKENDLLILDGGSSTEGIESTIIEIDHHSNSIKILRPGPIGIQAIREAIQNAPSSLRLQAMVLEVKKSDPKAPGHLKHHYQPLIPLVIINDLKELLAFKECYGEKCGELILDNDPCLAARYLYEQMRTLSQNESIGNKFIYVIKRDEHREEKWMAVWDRLNRAATNS